MSSKTKEHTAVKASERMMRLITQPTYILQLRDTFCVQQRVPIGFTLKKKIQNFNLFGNLEDLTAWSSDEVGSLMCGRALLWGHMQKFQSLL